MLLRLFYAFVVRIVCITNECRLSFWIWSWFVFFVRRFRSCFVELRAHVDEMRKACIMCRCGIHLFKFDGPLIQVCCLNQVTCDRSWHHSVPPDFFFEISFSCKFCNVISVGASQTPWFFCKCRMFEFSMHLFSFLCATYCDGMQRDKWRYVYSRIVITKSAIERSALHGDIMLCSLLRCVEMWEICAMQMGHECGARVGCASVFACVAFSIDEKIRF